MPKHRKINRDDVQFENVKFFVCACPHCNEKNEIFADEITSAKDCKKCGKKIDFNECSFEVP